MKNKTSDSIVSERPNMKPVQGDIETSATHNNKKPLFIENQTGSPIVGVSNYAMLAEKVEKLLQRLSQLKEKIDNVESMEKAENLKKLIFSGKTRAESISVEKVNTEIVNNERMDEIIKDIVR